MNPGLLASYAMVVAGLACVVAGIIRSDNSIIAVGSGMLGSPAVLRAGLQAGKASASSAESSKSSQPEGASS